MKKFLIVLLSMAGTSAYIHAQPPCSPVVVIDSDISSNTTLSASNLYRIQGCVSITAGNTLTIPAGTVITFANNDNLMVEPGAYIQALGTSAAPIEFTSTAAAGSRVPLSNAGLIIRGNAAINESSLALPCAKTHSSGSTTADSSGVLNYVRFSYLSGSAGVTYLDNALSLVGVGNKTKIEHIQITNSANNGLGIIGGEQRINEVMVLNSKKSDVYIGLGAQPQIQSLLTLKKDLSMHDVAGTYGMLIENNRSTPGATPFTRPVISNASIIGPLQCDPLSVSSDYKDGILLRNNARADIYNTVVAFHNQYGLYIQDNATAQNTASTPNALNVVYSSFTNNASGDYGQGAFSWSSLTMCGANMTAWIETLASGCSDPGNEFSSFDIAYDNSFCGDFCGENFVPNFILDGDATELSVPDYTGLPGFFTTPTYRGAVQDASVFDAWISVCPQEQSFCIEQTLQKAGINPLQFVPNPAEGYTYATFETAVAGKAGMVLMDKVSGNVIRRQQYNLTKAGAQRLRIDTEGLQEGIYLLRIDADGLILHNYLIVK